MFKMTCLNNQNNKKKRRKKEKTIAKTINEVYNDNKQK